MDESHHRSKSKLSKRLSGNKSVLEKAMERKEQSNECAGIVEKTVTRYKGTASVLEKALSRKRQAINDLYGAPSPKERKTEAKKEKEKSINKDLTEQSKIKKKAELKQDKGKISTTVSELDAESCTKQRKADVKPSDVKLQTRNVPDAWKPQVNIRKLPEELVTLLQKSTKTVEPKEPLKPVLLSKKGEPHGVVNVETAALASHQKKPGPLKRKSPASIATVCERPEKIQKPSAKSISDQTIKKSQIATHITLEEYSNLLSAVNTKALGKITTSFLACEGVPKLFLSELFKQCEDTYVEWDQVHQKVFPEDAELPPTLAAFVDKARKKQPYENWDELVQYVLQIPHVLLNLCLGAMLKDRDVCSPYRTKDLLLRLGLIGCLLFGGTLHKSSQVKLQRKETQDLNEKKRPDMVHGKVSNTISESSTDDDTGNDGDEDIIVVAHDESNLCFSQLEKSSAQNKDSSSALTAGTVKPGMSVLKAHHASLTGNSVSNSPNPPIITDKTLRVKEEPLAKSSGANRKPLHASKKDIESKTVMPNIAFREDGTKLPFKFIKLQSSAQTSISQSLVRSAAYKTATPNSSRIEEKSLENAKSKGASENESISVKTQSYQPPAYHKYDIGLPPFHRNYAEGTLQQEFIETPNGERKDEKSYEHSLKCPLCTYAVRSNSETHLKDAYGDHILNTHCDPLTGKPYEETLLIVLAKKLYAEKVTPEEGRIFICPICFKVDISQECHYHHILTHEDQDHHLGCLVCCKWFNSYKELFDHYHIKHEISYSDLPDPDNMELLSSEASLQQTEFSKKEIARARATEEYVQLYIQMEKRHPGLLPRMNETFGSRKCSTILFELMQYFPINNLTFTVYEYTEIENEASTETQEAQKACGVEKARTCPFCKFSVHAKCAEDEIDKVWTQHMYVVHCAPKTKKVYDETYKIYKSKLMWLDNPLKSGKSDVFICPLCLCLETNRAEYHNHLLSHPGQEKHIMCFLCVRGYDSHTELFEHCRQAHNIDVSVKKTLPTSKTWPKQQSIKNNDCSNKPEVAPMTRLYLRIYCAMKDKHPGVIFPIGSHVTRVEESIEHANWFWEDDEDISGLTFCRICGDSFPYASSRKIHELMIHILGITRFDPWSKMESGKKRKVNFKSMKDDCVKNHVAQGKHVDVEEDIEESKLYDCHYCSKKFKEKTERNQHESHSHSHLSKNEAEITSKPKTKMLKCDYCSSSFSNRVDMKDHKLENHKPQTLEDILHKYPLSEEDWRSLGYGHLLMSCHQCGYKTTDRSKMSEHKEEVHSLMDYCMCITCGLLFKSPTCHLSHQKTCINYEKLKQEETCSKCQCVLDSPLLLSIHQKFINCTGNVDFKAADIAEYPKITGHPAVDMFEIENPETWLFYCRYCNAHFKKVSERDNHEKKEHLDEETIRRLKSQELDVEEWIRLGYGHFVKKCPLCNFRYTDVTQFRNHRETEHKETLACKHCAQGFMNMGFKMRHERACDKQPVKCEKCNAVCLTFKLLAEHQRLVNCTNDPNFVPYDPKSEPVSFLCYKCGVVFEKKNLLYKHKYVNCNNDPNFVKRVKPKTVKSPCERCGKMIGQGSMSFHLAMVNCTNDPDFKPSQEVKESFLCHVCKKCGNRYRKKIELYNHNARSNCDNSEDFQPRSRIGKKPKAIPKVECPKCSKPIRKQSLAYHLAAVNCTNDPDFIITANPVECEKCGKVFKTKSLLVGHMSVVNCTNDPDFKPKWNRASQARQKQTSKLHKHMTSQKLLSGNGDHQDLMTTFSNQKPSDCLNHDQYQSSEAAIAQFIPMPSTSDQSTSVPMTKVTPLKPELSDEQISRRNAAIFHCAQGSIQAQPQIASKTTAMSHVEEQEQILALSHISSVALPENVSIETSTAMAPTSVHSSGSQIAQSQTDESVMYRYLQEGTNQELCIEVPQSVAEGMDSEQLHQYLANILKSKDLVRDEASGEVIVYQF